MMGKPLQAGLDITSLNHGRMSQIHRHFEWKPEAFGVSPMHGGPSHAKIVCKHGPAVA